jgi:histidyl-tRNA synthetase
MRFFEGLAGAQHALELVDLGDAANARAAYNADVLGRLVEFIGAHENGASGVDELRQILQLSRASGVDARIKLDPTLARGLAYYTGAIIEMNVADLAGSLGGGGRYDNLVGMFLGKDVPACGFSLGLERILVVMDERGLFPRRIESGPADIMVTVWDEASTIEALKLATEIRRENVRVLFYPEVRKPAKQLFYADKQKIGCVIIVGPNEIQSGLFRVKDKRRGEQILSRAEIPATLRNWIDETRRL